MHLTQSPRAPTFQDFRAFASILLRTITTDQIMPTTGYTLIEVSAYNIVHLHYSTEPQHAHVQWSVLPWKRELPITPRRVACQLSICFCIACSHSLHAWLASIPDPQLHSKWRFRNDEPAPFWTHLLQEKLKASSFCKFSAIVAPNDPE